MPLAPWRMALARALHRNRSQPNSRYFQLATLGENGRPANRTVVFRGFWQDSELLQIVCDRRSAKVQQLQRYPWGEICWYFSETREQFRLAGEITLIAADCPNPAQQQARQQLWQQLSNAARLQFAWPHPGQPRRESSVFPEEPPSVPAPLAVFCLLLFQPQSVDFLELRGNPQNRWRYDRDESGQWTEIALNP